MPEAVGEVACMPGGRDRTRRVEQDRVPSRAFCPGKNRADRGGVLLRRSAPKLAGVAARNAELEWIDLALAHGSADDLADEVGSGGRELVDPAGSVHDKGAACAESRQHVGDRAHELGRVDADDLRRSEERRVGKECRSRGWRDDEKKEAVRYGSEVTQESS